MCPEASEVFDAYQAKIMVFGCGGGGCNTITRLTDMDIKGAVTVGVNTDAKHLSVTRTSARLFSQRRGNTNIQASRSRCCLR